MDNPENNGQQPSPKKVACAGCLDEYCFDELKEGLCTVCIEKNTDRELKEFTEY